MLRPTLIAALIATSSPFWAHAQDWEENYDDQWADERPPDYDVSVDVGVSGGVTFDTFYAPLGAHGEWVSAGAYGRVWRPRVAAGWRPYYYGRWEWTSEGWFWVSDEPWGWAAYHYGRWAFDGAYGWVWIPGYQWAPAWVSWRWSGDVVGWAPLAPGLSVYVTSYPFYDAWWTFVPSVSFVSVPVYSVAYAPSYTRHYWDRTTPAPARPAPRPIPGRARPAHAASPAWGGPAPRAIEARMGRPLRPPRVVAAPSPAAARAGPARSPCTVPRCAARRPRPRRGVRTARARLGAPASVPGRGDERGNAFGRRRAVASSGPGSHPHRRARPLAGPARQGTDGRRPGAPRAVGERRGWSGAALEQRDGARRAPRSARGGSGRGGHRRPAVRRRRASAAAWSGGGGRPAARQVRRKPRRPQQHGGGRPAPATPHRCRHEVQREVPRLRRRRSRGRSAAGRSSLSASRREPCSSSRAPVSRSRADMVRIPSTFTSKRISSRTSPARQGRTPLKVNSPRSSFSAGAGVVALVDADRRARSGRRPRSSPRRCGRWGSPRCAGRRRASRRPPARSRSPSG